MASMMLGGGYVVAALGPFLLGLIRDLAGSFRLATWVLLAITVVLLAVALTTSHERLRRRSHAAGLPRQVAVPGGGEDLA